MEHRQNWRIGKPAGHAAGWTPLQHQADTSSYFLGEQTVVNNRWTSVRKRLAFFLFATIVLPLNNDAAIAPTAVMSRG